MAEVVSEKALMDKPASRIPHTIRRIGSSVRQTAPLATAL